MSRTQSGLSLVWVLVAISGITVGLIQLAYTNMLQRDRLAYEKTLVQIHSIMNFAYAYRARHSEWPLGGSGQCQMPRSYVDGVGDFLNGWGHEIEGVSNCNALDDRYAVEQIIPKPYLAVFNEALEEEIESVDVDNPPDSTKMIVRLHESMVEENKMYFGELDNQDGFAFDAVQCAEGENPQYLIGLEGVCANVSYQSADSDDDINPSGSPVAAIHGWSAWASTDSGSDVPYVYYKMYVSDEDSFLDRTMNDNYLNANDTCPNDADNKSKISAVVLAWCR